MEFPNIDELILTANPAALPKGDSDELKVAHGLKCPPVEDQHWDMAYADEVATEMREEFQEA